MLYYKLLIRKTNGEIIQLGKSEKDINVIKERRNNFLIAKRKGLRPFHTAHTLIVPVLRKKMKKVARYPKGTTKTVMTRDYYRTYNGKRKLIKAHPMKLGGKVKPKKKK